MSLSAAIAKFNRGKSPNNLCECGFSELTSEKVGDDILCRQKTYFAKFNSFCRPFPSALCGFDRSRSDRRPSHEREVV